MAIALVTALAVASGITAEDSLASAIASLAALVAALGTVVVDSLALVTASGIVAMAFTTCFRHRARIGNQSKSAQQPYPCN